MGPFAYRSWVEISLKQIADNFRAVCDVVGPDVEVMPVVKADAYRHGAVEVSRALVAAGARWLAVSNVEEGAILRDRGITGRILVMADFLPAERSGLLDYNLTPVIHSLADIAEWDRLVAARNITADYHLKIDSGMGRLGTRARASEILEAIGRAKHARLEGLMTHFASAANYASTQTDEQLAVFESTCAELAKAGVHPPILHLSSSTPIAYGRRGAWQRMVRPGHAVYGYVSQIAKGSAPARLLDVRPALAWKAAVLAVKDLPAGVLVGYGGMYRTTQPSRIAVLAAGYADGIPHRLSNKGRVIAKGRWAPIIGAVSMDLTTIDITHCEPLAPGDAVTLIGTEGDLSIDAQQVARVAGTISYSVLCGIHARVKRIYVENG
ncbi:MAG TPA: alanine racemase [Bryobacteraceae bacterium]|jgi:alanine racemase|nr:alanine racemase [Bryobacteraceae bacterium]